MRRWIGIATALVVVLCLLAACTGGATTEEKSTEITEDVVTETTENVTTESINTNYDHLLVGSWKLSSVMINGEGSTVDFHSTVSFYDDHTGCFITDDTLPFSWEYMYSGSQMEVFELTTNDGLTRYVHVSASFICITWSHGLDDYVLYFQRN